MIDTFGSTADGQTVHGITLVAGDLRVRILTLGAILQSVRLAGVDHDLTLGSDRIEDYLGDLMYHGPLIGPVVNRLSDAQAVIGGVRHHFDVNFNGRHTLHSGEGGTHRQIWQILSATDSACTLGLTLAKGAGGFPGGRQVTAVFAATAPASLTMTVTTTTDAETIVNFANHSYWNLDGSETWSGHRLQVAADAYLPNDHDFKPTGEIRRVSGTDMDFRHPRTIAPGAPDLDTCMCLGRDRVALRDVLWLTGTSGLTMTLATTEPGVQVYDQRAPARPGRAVYEGLALECQGWPDAPNHPDFPPITLKTGESLTQITQWRFSR